MHEPMITRSLSKVTIESVRIAYETVCKKFLDASPDHPYYDYVKSSIGNLATLDRHIRAFELYAPYLTPEMQVLDWGCRHAPDSCMMRTLHPNLRLHGCDFIGDDFSVFHRYSKLEYKQIQHEFKLPYENSTFDVLLSSGVLEHVGFENESVREVWRVLKDGGLFVVTFLPNRTSLTENLSRLLGSYVGHNRLYDLVQTKNMFLRTGFVIEQCGYHQVFPSFGKNVEERKLLNAIATLGAKLNRPTERIPVLNAMAANLYFVLRRVRHM